MIRPSARGGRGAAALSLVLLAPVIGELLSGSTAPLVFLLSPGIAAFEIALYGAGALVVRELVVNWRRGWISVLILGAAYGLIEEGVVLKAAFDAAWPGADALGPYGRIGEVGSVWLVQVVVFHAVVSITIPILLIGLAFPDQRGQPWLGSRQRVVLVGLWSLAVVAAGLVVRREYALEPSYAVVCVAVAGLVACARLAPVPTARSSRAGARRLVVFAGGVVATGSFFLASWSGPESGRPPVVTIGLQLSVVGLAVLWLHRATRAGGLDDRARLALAGGVLGPFILLALPRLTDGGAVVGVVMLAGLLTLWRRTARVEARFGPSI